MKNVKRVLIVLLCVCVIAIQILLVSVQALVGWKISQRVLYDEAMTLASDALLREYTQHDSKLYYDSKLFYIEEHDRYGRFIFSGYAPVKNLDDFIIIVQIVDREQHCIYYYPEYALLTMKNIDDLTDEEYEAFKTQNDWGKPLNREKMVSYEEK